MDRLIQKYGFYLTVEDLCDLLQVSRPVVDRMIAIRELPVTKVGKMYRVATDDYVLWWNERVQRDRKETQIKLLRGAI